jgi:hypothetical protein
MRLLDVVRTVIFLSCRYLRCSRGIEFVYHRERLERLAQLLVFLDGATLVLLASILIVHPPPI